MRILIIEDNPDILANLFGFLEPRGHTLDCATNGFAGLSFAAEGTYDAIVLDVMLPGLNGVDLCRRLRTEMNNATPVLMLTARDTLEDKVNGFTSGADDYLVKPFSLVELEVRLQALVRRAKGLTETSTLVVGDLHFDCKSFHATRAGRPLSLTKTGFIILGCLMRASPAVVSREELEYAIWGDNRPQSDALRTHIHALRQTLDKSETAPMLQTVSGIGFKLIVNNETL
ncbi:response regulator transcription factor [Massilia yuzhufengensis]|jgi:DNA-binding response OmpR family regulator|uniref:DNA-binding response regulator, OmpR family, contains REC and winged-helix (WHTH) domain n=1 Tax=Massilia yuzhufengensis TaxID=1164594 RepID=A0A1I1R626_9BURK|nr:response regulator transcription factor [Massilia yuzhufengensis]SFD29776.1 DNA-binding response regulator, OmpR family, contains REC and winged-helix (wHTH) domain [Massilia yuzhufengensis]